MSTSWVVRLLAVLLISALLLVPLGMIRGLIDERSSFRDQARASIAESWTGSQRVLGPLLALSTGETAQYLSPVRLDIRGDVRTELRRRGIYTVPVYSTRLVLSGEFDLREVPAETQPIDGVLAMALDDTRGVGSQPTAIWGENRREFLPGSCIAQLPTGIHAPLGAIVPGGIHSFRIEFELRGMEALAFAPVGGDTRVELSSNWSHPSFFGRFLPREYAIDDDGFTASWETSAIASGARSIETALNEDHGKTLADSAFGVRLVGPVDAYVQSTRSTKYGILFVVLTFLTFFVAEVTRKLLLHPVQYGLVGLALTLFFLLLLALSEHLPFLVAYLLAAVACCGLIGVYTGSVMGNSRYGLGSTGVLGVLYVTLYVILQSEDSALLAGSVLLFVCLATLMLATRKIDWRRLDGSVTRT